LVERTIKEIENPEELLEMGLVAGIRNGKFENAIEFFQKAIELEPNNSRAWFLLGLAHDYRENIDQAIDCYLKAIELYPDYLEALVNLGTDYTKIGDLDKAVACFTEALDIKPDYIEAMVNLGQVYLERDNPEEAIDVCSRALLFTSEYQPTYTTLGRAYLQLNDHDKATEFFEKALELKPNDYETYNFLAWVSVDRKDIQEAIRLFTKALQLNANYYEAHNNLGVVFAMAGNLPKAIECFEKAVEIKPKYYEALHNLASAYEEIGDLEKAEKFILVKDDLVQSYLFITRLLDRLASIVVMINGQVPGRESVEQATQFEPELFAKIYSDVVLKKTTKEELLEIISTIRNYLKEKTPVIFRPVIEYLKKEQTFRSVTDIAHFLNKRLNDRWWTIAGAVGIGNWLALQGYCERVPCPTRLTLRSHDEVSEIGFYYIRDE